MKPQSNTIRFLILLLVGTVMVPFLGTGNSVRFRDNPALLKQRAQFIVNTLHHFSWPAYSIGEKFRIGILGNDETYEALKSFCEGRIIKEKSIEVVKYSSIPEVDKVNILYVNQDQNFQMEEIHEKVRGESVLLIGEDFPFQQSMINLRFVNNALLYEINERMLMREKLKPSPEILENGITSVDRWQQLYEKSEVSLEEERKKVNEQRLSLLKLKDEIFKNNAVLEEKTRQLKLQKKDIEKKNIELSLQDKNLQEQSIILENQMGKIQGFDNELRLLTKLNEEKQVDLEEKISVISEKELELGQTQTKLRNSQSELSGREENLLSLIEETTLQEAKLIEQKQTLLIQEEKVRGQATLIEQKNRTLYLFFAFLILSLLFLATMIWNNRARKRVNLELVEKNLEIQDQAIQLENTNELLEQFAFVASHDLQEPLRTVSNFVEVIEEDYGPAFDDEGKKYLNQITSATHRMRNMITGLLNFSRIGAEQEWVLLDTPELVKNILSDLSQVIKEKKATIELGDLPGIIGSESEIRSLFQNLIGNAIKFRKKEIDPVIHIWGEDAGDYWNFTVQDNGIGIPEEHKDKIFVIFKRLHNRKTYKGTGIGLAHCKKIVEVHGGDIWVESKEGVGSNFVFSIEK